MKTLLMLVSLMALSCATATDYFWHTAQDGDFSVAANWRLGRKGADGEASQAPGAGDTVYFCTGEYTVRLSADTTVGSVYPDNTDNHSEMHVTFDLQDYVLRADTINARADVSHPSAWVTYRNGSVFCQKVCSCDNDAAAWQGTLLLKDLDLEASGEISILGNYTALEIGEGSTVHAAGRLYFRERSTNALVRITGDGTRVSVDGNIQQNGTGSIEVSDGAELLTAINLYLNGYESDTLQDFGGTMTVDAATLTSTGLSTRVFVGGATLHGVRLTLTNGALCQGFGYAEVGGNTSFSNRVEIIDGAILRMDGIQYYADGDPSRPSRTCDGLMLSNNAKSQENVLFVSNGVYEARFLRAGYWGDASWDRAASNNWIHVAGTNSLIHTTAGNNGMTLISGSCLRFDICAEGYCRTPVQIDYGLSCQRATADAFKEIPNKLFIDAAAFDRAQPNTSVELVSTGRDSTAAFSELVANLTLLGGAGEVIIGADGRSLAYKSPKKPGLSVFIR